MFLLRRAQAKNNLLGLKTGKHFHGIPRIGKVVLVLPPDPESGYPPKDFLRRHIPLLSKYPDGSLLPSPSKIDFTPGELLGCYSGKLGLEDFVVNTLNHELHVTSDKDGDDCELDRLLPEADILITTPYHPANMTEKRIKMAKQLKLIITAGVGSDHIDLDTALQQRIDIAEVTYSNSISRAEYQVLQLLSLVKNYIPAYTCIDTGGSNIAECSSRAYDLEGMRVGTIGAGRKGRAVMKRLKAFDCVINYTDTQPLPLFVERELGATYWERWEDMVPEMDAVLFNCPLHQATLHMVNDSSIKLFKQGSYIVNNAKGGLCDEDTISHALQTGHLAGYAGERDPEEHRNTFHPWRSMPYANMTCHVSGTSLPAQARYSAGVREILEDYVQGVAIRKSYQVGTNGKLCGEGIGLEDEVYHWWINTDAGG